MSLPALQPWLPAFDAACAAGIVRPMRPGTRTGGVSKRGLVLRCLRALEPLGYELADLGKLSDAHLQALARYWSYGTLPPVKRDTRLVALHAFIGEVTARPARRSVADHIACAHAVLSACGAARRLCWSAIGIDVDGLLGRIAARDPYVAMQLALQRAFGLGVAEVLPLRPHEADRGGYLAVRTETDTRRIPIDTPQQRATLDAAKRLAPYPGAALHAPGAPPCELIQRYHAECFAAGFALSGLRIHASAIRHEGALAEILAAAAQARVPCLDREVCRVDR